MVEIREESGANEPGAGGSNSQRTQDAPRADGQPPRQSTMDYLRANPVDSVLLILRILTIFFALLYAFPVWGGPQQQANFYSKAFLAGAATNALRLHQRLGGFRFSLAFLQSTFTEDSCHYLFYCIIFLGSFPVTMALMPVFLFALLHASSTLLKILNAAEMTGSFLWRLANKLVENYSQTLLQVIACSEIFLMPIVIIMIFMGRANLLIPFIYYRFLTLRYMSRRNPNTRVAFRQMRLALEQAVTRAGCPAAFRTAAFKFIGIVERLAPAMDYQQEQPGQ